jgi:hypothetical protein
MTSAVSIEDIYVVLRCKFFPLHVPDDHFLKEYEKCWRLTNTGMDFSLSFAAAAIRASI